MALRTQLSSSMTFKEVVQRVRDTVYGAQSNAEVCPHTSPCDVLHAHLAWPPCFEVKDWLKRQTCWKSAEFVLPHISWGKSHHDLAVLSVEHVMRAVSDGWPL